MGFDVTLRAERWRESTYGLESRPVFDATLAVVWRGVPYSVEFGWSGRIDARTGQVEMLGARYLVRPPADLVPKITPEAAERAAHDWARRTVQAARPVVAHPTRLVISFRGEDNLRDGLMRGVAWEDAYPGTLAYEAYVRDEAAAGPEAGEAYTVFVDAKTGEAFRALGSLLRRGNVVYEWDKDRQAARGG